MKNGKSGVQILKEGDLAVVGPGVLHCINSILGDYEHIVVQVPSAFQYGFDFKQTVKPPSDYDEDKLKLEAKIELEGYKMQKRFEPSLFKKPLYLQFANCIKKQNRG